MSSDIEGLVRTQYDLYGRIARSYDNLKKAGSTNVTLGLVEARLQSLESNWTKFENYHHVLITQHWDALSSHDYQKQEVLSRTEEAYLTQKALFLDTLRTLKETVSVPSTSVITDAPRTPRTTLPRIQLPQFSGQYEDWPAFRDLFHSIISKDAATNPVEKLHYLKASLKGEADQLIRSLPTTDENFDRAWKTLSDYYENKRLLVRSYISRFSSLQKLKSESATDLRQLYHCVLSTVGSLESIGRSILRGEDLFVHLIVDLLDSRSRREWENFVSNTPEPPSYSTLNQFLERRLHTLESLQSMKPESNSTKSAASRSTRTLQAYKQENKRGQCSLCKKDHFIMVCDIYKSKTAEERKHLIEAQNRCFNCLGKHKLSECSSQRTCSTCNAKHHSSLHEAFPIRAVLTTSQVRSSCASTVVLLATARVRVADRFGEFHTVRALIDQGSESSLISESLSQRLRLPRSSASVAVIGVGGRQTGFSHGRVKLQITSNHGEASVTVSALIFPRLTLYDGGLKMQKKQWRHLKGLQLADPEFLRADPIDLLLGADAFAMILQNGVRKGDPQEPIGQKTLLGWIISGPIGATSSPRSTLTHQCRAEEDLFYLVRQFWQQEELSLATDSLTPEEKECEDFFLQTYSREPNGRYVVRLPVKNPLPDLSSIRNSAKRVLFSMESKFQRSGEFRQLYTDFMRQYEEMNHMSRAPVTPDLTRVCYLPHHGVMREASTTTRLRVVFNGSTETSSGSSLNQNFLVGANLLPQLADLLLRWRRHRYVLVSDVEKMYRQILVHPDDRDLQRILWRYQSSEGLNEYRLNTITYGLSCAPFLAMRTLRQLAEDEKQHFPLGAEVLRQDVYMDDILTGADDVSKAHKIQRQLTGLCTAGGFPLRKWSSNHPAILDDVPAEHRLQGIISWQAHETHTTLGLHWHPSTDVFSFSTREIAVSRITKRSVLSLTARLFDPLGWLAPVIVRAKIAFQSTWLRGLDWDEPFDEEATRWWNNYQSDLPSLEKIQIPRWLLTNNSTDELDLHGFADASERAFGAVLYMRVREEGLWRTTLVIAKTKVAPLKQVSLPRLELCAATLLARLSAHIKRTLSANCPLHLWSDSMVTLGWIRGHPTKWKTYVANRVSEIQTSVPDAIWHHVPTKDNPADLASRGLSPSELVTSQLWWSGPGWLKRDSSSWPKLDEPSTKKSLPEERRFTFAISKITTHVVEAVELLRHSNLNRLLRVTAWCLRWLPRNRSHSTTFLHGTLTVQELETARKLWILQVQATFFRQELSLMKQGKPLAKSNSLTCLSPFTDNLGMLRVGGRLRHAILSYDERHPVILPKESHFTGLIVDACHRRSLHGGVQLTLGILRQNYWIPRGRALVKQQIHRCIVCTRWRAATPQPIMGDLPRERIQPTRAFLHTGVDYAGPIHLRTSKGRGQRSYKAFIAVFVCLSTRAVHLEVVSDYSTEAFLASLRRFTSRRGLCQTLRSDCGTNFVGADIKLRELLASNNAQCRHIADQLASQGIQWRFNPPAAPHFGGIWEAAVNLSQFETAASSYRRS